MPFFAFQHDLAAQQVDYFLGYGEPKACTTKLTFDTGVCLGKFFENFSMFIRNFLPRYPQPQADAIENLSMAVVVDQKRLGGGSHSTMGTITDISPVLRLLYSRIGQPHAGRGHATAAARAMVAHAFDELKLHRVEAACVPSNLASRRVLEKSGFVLEGQARAYLKINGAWADHLLFGVVNDAAGRGG